MEVVMEVTEVLSVGLGMAVVMNRGRGSLLVSHYGKECRKKRGGMRDVCVETERG